MFISFNVLSFKKYHKNYIGLHKKSVLDQKVFFPRFCNFGFKLCNSAYITQIQVESVRRVIRRFFKKNVFLKTNLLLSLPLTKKPISIRMGKGKGKFDKWVSPIKRGRVFYELLSFDKKKHKNKYYVLLLKKVNSKLPVKVNLVSLKY